MARQPDLLPFDARSSVSREGMERLKQATYPGRGLIVGWDNEGRLIQVYWLTGRSKESHTRVLVQNGSDIDCVPSVDNTGTNSLGLLTYRVMTVVDGQHVVSNGDQTDTIVQGLQDHISMASSLVDRTFEPDAPHFTPRISAVQSPTRLTFSRIERESVDGVRVYGEFTPPEHRGMGYCLHTYDGSTESPLPTFTAFPFSCHIVGSLDQIAMRYWEALGIEYRIALVAQAVDPTTEETSYNLINTKLLPPNFSLRRKVME